MANIFTKAYWKMRFLFGGKPTKEYVDAKLAAATAPAPGSPAHPEAAPPASPNCDCAVYSSAGDFIHCYPNIPKYKCDALQDGNPDLETDPLPVGGCAAIPRKP